MTATKLVMTSSSGRKPRLSNGRIPAGLNVGGEIARIHIGDQCDDRRAAEREIVAHSIAPPTQQRMSGVNGTLAQRLRSLLKIIHLLRFFKQLLAARGNLIGSRLNANTCDCGTCRISCGERCLQSAVGDLPVVNVAVQDHCLAGNGMKNIVLRPRTGPAIDGCP